MQAGVRRRYRANRRLVMNPHMINSEKRLRLFCESGEKPKYLVVLTVRLKKEHIDAIFHERLTNFNIGYGLKFFPRPLLGFNQANEATREYF